MSETTIVNPLDSLLGYRLRRVSAMLMQEFSQSLDDIGLRPSEAAVLVLIEANPLITQSDVGRLLDIQRANMAPLAARLEQRSLIIRSPTDGRSFGMRTTIAGQQAAGRALAIMRAHEERIVACLPAAARDELPAALAALAASEIPR